MNSKKILMIIMAVIIAAIIGVLAWKGIGNKTGSNSTVPTTENPITTATTAGGGIGKMTDDIYVEIRAQGTYYARKDPASRFAHAENLYKKYDITEENIIAYRDALSNDPQHAAEIAQKYTQRLTELMSTGK
jgi:hypothetical protein